ncbi:MAG TPA: alpha-glucan family phosphorylase [Chthoniobacterales bacterium]|nr:alpha-glucan family phosphorylase [Chthoniobacterales bacterium]
MNPTFKPIGTFSVIPSLPAPIERLRKIAYNLRWAWSHDSIDLFRRLDRDLWETSGHNPVLMLGTIDQEKLEAVSQDDAFLAHLDYVSEKLEAYLRGESSWFRRFWRDKEDKPLVAYFSAEFGLTECLSIFAGGLGILAGDHLKSASDLGIPLIGVGLLYQQGYFRQYLNQAGWQQESYENNDFHNLPVIPVDQPDGKPLIVRVEYPGRSVSAQIWRAQVGRIPLYLLDTNIAANEHAEDRDITDQLYGGDREMRIKQEILLGIGGYRALKAIGIEPSVYHMNEGHSAFLALERIRNLMETHHLSFAEAHASASPGLVFTTHTPVEAGHDYFSPDQMDRYFGVYSRSLGLSMPDFLALGRSALDAQSLFCMTVLALRLSSHRNGVSKLHGDVSRRMWQRLWPGVPADEIPIQHITNGVHFRSWISLEMNQLYDRYLGPHWREEPADHEVWDRVYSIPAEELWRVHERRRERLVVWARNWVRKERLRRGAPESEIEAAAEVLDPATLTIGFARRFATYKRATLILHDLPRLQRILSDSRCPVQFVFAGKAHPLDDAGKEYIRQIAELTQRLDLGRHLVFLEDYDMAVARYLVQGVDVWLNTPLRPNEASGTSGMKAAANGVLNLSVLDGWWDEVWRSQDQPTRIGWAIGKGETYQDPKYQDQVEAEALYGLLERDVIPTFYDRGPDGVPRKWIEHMKASIGKICPFVNTHRMVKDYACKVYLKAHEQYRALEKDGASRAKALAAWIARVRQEWPHVRIEAVEQTPSATLPVGTEVHVRTRIQLGSLSPEDVAVEFYLGRLNPSGDFINAISEPMKPVEKENRGTFLFEAATRSTRSGLHGFTFRVRPYHPDLSVPFLPDLICWADSSVPARS